MKCFDKDSKKSPLSRLLRLFFLLATAIIIYSCQSPQEKKGASAIPVNKPADWENNFMPTAK